MTDSLPTEIWSDILDIVLHNDVFEYVPLSLVNRFFLRLIQDSAVVYETNNKTGVTTITPLYNTVNARIPFDADREISKYIQDCHTAPKLILYRNMKRKDDLKKFNDFYEEAIVSKNVHATVVRVLNTRGYTFPRLMEQLIDPRSTGPPYRTRYIDHTLFKTDTDEAKFIETAKMSCRGLGANHLVIDHHFHFESPMKEVYYGELFIEYVDAPKPLGGCRVRLSSRELEYIRGMRNHEGGGDPRLESYQSLKLIEAPSLKILSLRFAPYLVPLEKFPMLEDLYVSELDDGQLDWPALEEVEKVYSMAVLKRDCHLPCLKMLNMPYLPFSLRARKLETLELWIKCSHCSFDILKEGHPLELPNLKHFDLTIGGDSEYMAAFMSKFKEKTWRSLEKLEVTVAAERDPYTGVLQAGSLYHLSSCFMFLDSLLELLIIEDSEAVGEIREVDTTVPTLHAPRLESLTLECQSLLIPRLTVLNENNRESFANVKTLSLDFPSMIPRVNYEMFPQCKQRR